MRTTTWLIDWASCWTAPGVTPDGGAVALPEDIPLPASSAERAASPADSRRYRMALPVDHWRVWGQSERLARLCQARRRVRVKCSGATVTCRLGSGEAYG